MVDRIRSRSIWGRLTAPSRIKKVKRHKDNPNDDFQEQLKKRRDEKKKEADGGSRPGAESEKNESDKSAPPEEEGDQSRPSAKSKTGRRVDIHI